MKNKNNKECIVCSTRYTYCPSCAEFINIPKWKNIYHDENCKNIFAIASDYAHGLIGKDEARIGLEKCDLSCKKTFRKNILAIINEVCAEKKEEKVEIVKETSVAPAESVVSEVAETVEVKEKVSKKNSKKELVFE